MTLPAHMWSYYREDKGYEGALSYFPQYENDPRIVQAVAQMMNAWAAMDKFFEEKEAEEGDYEDDE